MNKQRPSKRTKIIFPIEFGLSQAGSGEKKEATGEMVNISKDGACIIITDAVFQEEENIEFNIKIPDKLNEMFKSEGPIQAKASVVWKQDHRKKDKTVKYGIKFKSKKLYNSIIEKLIDYEYGLLTHKDWHESHPDILFPSVPISSEMLEGMKPSAISVDVTNICNLNCKHCFWDAYQRQINQSTNPNILDSVKEVLDRFKSITNILWYGGEPLINKETRNIVKEGVKLKKNNLIITNGTFPLPVFDQNVHYAISIDGTEKTHNFLRGRNIYGRIKQNIETALIKEMPVALLFCINAYNMNTIPEFLKEWAGYNIMGVGFTVYTPMLNKFSYLTQTDEQRFETMETLKKMKQKYGDFIFNSNKMIELLDPKYGEELEVECPMNLFNQKSRVYCLHLCNDGTIRIPCSIGRDASHKECRSITKVALYAGTILKDRDSYRSLLRMYLSNYQNRSKRLK